MGVDAGPFKAWYKSRFGVELGKSKGEVQEEVKKSGRVLRKLAKRRKNQEIEKALADQFMSGRLLACISSRPGQCGRADGYILEGPELAFYQRKMRARKGK